MKPLALVLALALLAACGADGDPVPPEQDTPATRNGVQVGVEGWAGVKGRW
ncbi:argininosuccinate lyase [Mesobacterium pallidum]|uniref:argininosuccinate lyase n=1 Tax=Mesobacterium pallidum TaxID=2872037 RepID=UPI001EE2F06C|nr:argininosuccinate lyase [Mesobacterium pallidum]